MSARVQPPPQLLTLRDGRRLAYCWWGAPLQQGGASSAAGGTAVSAAGAADAAGAGRRSPPPPPTQQQQREHLPVLYFHGFTSSRLEAGSLHDDAEAAGVSVVAVDRPGAGHSTLNPQQARLLSVESMAADALELLDALGLARVVVQGVSGGAPFACAVAALLPKRVAALLLVCPLAQTAGREARLLAGHAETSLRLHHRIKHQPWRLWASLHLLRLIQRVPHGNLLLRVGGFAEADIRAMHAAPAAAAQLAAGVREGLRQGVAGAMRDLQIYYVDPPSTDLAAIRAPAHIWHGSEDRTTPPAMAEFLAGAIPGARLHMLEGEGHLSLPFQHNAAILGSVFG